MSIFNKAHATLVAMVIAVYARGDLHTHWPLIQSVMLNGGQPEPAPLGQSLAVEHVS